MRFTSFTVLLVSLVASIHAGVVPREADGVLESREGDVVFGGTITTYSDADCKKASATFYVSDGGILSGKIGLDTQGIIADLPCAVEVETNKETILIGKGNKDCHSIERGSEIKSVKVNCQVTT
ncbi:hypothetical protein E5D57_002862 [Metarhizium anisopliae]|nr:hypothetical protein E5D57_002862 [Metarhizium anisopliae]